MATALKNVVVIGGSYVGINTVRQLMAMLPSTHRVLLIEPHSHFNHIFAFPRYAILNGHEHKAFIPYSVIFTKGMQHKAIRARATRIDAQNVEIDTKWEGLNKIPFDYLVLATGTRLAAPSMMPYNDKPSSIQFLNSYQKKLQRAKHITIIGGGAVGVQMSLDLKELNPEKEVTLVHSRGALMHQFHRNFSTILEKSFDDHGIQLILNTRAKVPEGGFPEDGGPFTVALTNGQHIETNFVIAATGQTPNSELVNSLPTTNPEGLVNPSNGYIRIENTLQIQDDAYPHIFAVGDVADTGLYKAARPGASQAKATATNIVSMISGEKAEAEFERTPRAIHMSLGLKRNMVFVNPDEENGKTEPVVKDMYDGELDMKAGAVWARFDATMPVSKDAEGWD